MRNTKTYRLISAPMLALLALLFFGATTITAAPGDLDPTFGNGGIAIAHYGNTGILFYTAGAMAIQTDGKIVVVGEGNAGARGYWHSAVVRFNPDGSLDSSFAGAGAVVTQLGSYYDGARAVAIQPDGKIVVVSSVSDGLGVTGKFGVVRYNPNGSLDTSFNGSGIVLTPVGSAGNSNSVAIQTDGKIVVAGSNGNDSLAIVRYNPNGSLDTTFNGSGIVLTPVGWANSVAIQADGKIIVGGGKFGSTTLVRYNADGSLDTSFNGTGIVSIPAGHSFGANLWDLAIQTDGKIVAVGNIVESTVVRYNPDGSLDSSFGGTGKIPSPAFDYASSVAIQPNGKIVVGGISYVGALEYDSVFAVGRLNPNGSVDTSFNGTGIVTTSVGKRYGNASYDEVGLVAIQADGKIVLAGDSGPDEFKSFVVVRYQGDSATPTSCPNPIDCAEFFVRQHYRDFLNREPDSPGLAHWAGEISACNDPSRRQPGESLAVCSERKRTNTSAAFFLSPEFQYTGYFVYRLYKGSLIQNGAGRFPTYDEFMKDARQVAADIIQNNQLSAAKIEENKKKFAEEFTQRAEFRSLYDPLSNFDYVERLFQTTGVSVSAPDKQALVNGLNNQTETRASILQKVVDGTVVLAEGNQQFTTAYGQAFYQKEFNAAFVLMEYFGYLQRDPDPAGYQHWLDKLNFYGNYIEAEMVRSFITSPEYRARFGQP